MQSQSYPPACYYCGMPADTIDHVVPRSILEAAKRAGDLESWLALQGRGRRMEVAACFECNVILQAEYDHTLADRKARLKRLLRKRLRRDLDMPDWDDHEIMELSPRLRDWILVGLERRRLARLRISW